MASYWTALRSSKYVAFKLGPALTLLLLSQFGSIWTNPAMQSYSLWVAIIWAFVVVFWWSYDVLNEELERRDGELLLTTPRMRQDRAFRLLSTLLQDGQKTLHGWKPEQIEKWDHEVRLTLAQWCNPGVVESYLNDTRAYGEVRLTEPQKALDALRTITNIHLQVYVK